MGFYDAIQLFFMELTGRAMMFSGRDLELLSRWRSEGASVVVICRGLEDAVKGMDRSDPPRNIYGCRHYIEPRVEQARKNAIGRHEEAVVDEERRGNEQKAEEPEVVSAALAEVERAGKAVCSEPLRAVYREAWRKLRDLGEVSGPETYEALATIEQGLAEGYFEALAAADRAAIEERIARELVGMAQMSAEARREHLLARRRLYLIRDYGMASLWT